VGRIGRVGAVALLVAGATAAVALAALSPKQLRASIVAAAKAQRSVHYVNKQVVGNSLSTLTGDVEAADGIQHIKIVLGKQTAHLTIIVLDQTAYLEGDAVGLQFQGLTKSQATAYAGKWISIPKGDKLYAGTAEDVTLGSVIQIITPHGALAVFKAKEQGTRVIGVRGTSGTGKKKLIQALATKAGGKRLPFEEDEFAPGESYISRTVLSKWNEPVQVQAPASSTPIATVRGS
jgi:hypothetical protein